MANTEKLIVVLDPGHVKGYNIGINKTYVEGEKMFALATYLKAELEKYDGIEVYNTRNAVTEDPSLNARGKMAKDKCAKVFMSLHTNAASGNAYGVVIYRSYLKEESIELADKLGNAIADFINDTVSQTTYRGCLILRSNSGQDYYGVIRSSVSDVVDYTYIVEHAFHSTLAECNWLDQDNHLRALAVKEAAVLAEYFGKVLKSGQTTPTTPVVDPVTPVSYTNYTIKSGDTMWEISKKLLGDPMRYHEILEFNKMTAKTVINPGDVIKIPGANVIIPVEKTYTVVANDSWWGIAYKVMGSGAKYKELAAYNGKTSASVINPGDVIKIPA